MTLPFRKNGPGPTDVHVTRPLSRTRKLVRLLLAKSEGRYLARRVANADELSAWAARHGLPDVDPHLHVTVLYTKQPIAAPELQYDVLSAVPLSTGLLGEDGALVVHLRCEDVEARWAQFDAEDGYNADGYKPHVTLCYLSADEFSSLPHPLPVPDFPIILGPEITSTLDEGDVFLRKANPYREQSTGKYTNGPGSGGAFLDPGAVAHFQTDMVPLAPVLNGVPLAPWDDAPTTTKGWATVEGTNPELDNLGKLPRIAVKRKGYTAKDGTKVPDSVSYKRMGAGVIIQEPDGRVWITEPTNHFGGYRHTFPKGGKEKGMGLQQTAIKEAFEETGLKVKLIGHVTDVERDTSVARYYLAVRVGGTPTKAHWETDKVKLAPMSALRGLMNREVDKHIAAILTGVVSKAVGNPYRDPGTGKYISGGSGVGAAPPPTPTTPMILTTTPTAATILAEKVAGPGGSNPGGVYKGADGVLRYVKFYADPAQAHGEHLANQIYRDLGHQAPDSQVFETPKGTTAYASKIIPDTKELQHVGLTPERARAVLDGFAADIVTANWDAVGLVHDNVKFAPGNPAPIRVDNGGTFLMRAQAGRKPEGALDGISEYQKFADGTNPAYRKVFTAAGTTPAQMAPQFKKQVQAISELRAKSGGWASYVAKAIPDAEPKVQARIAQMLEARTKALVSLAGVSLAKRIAHAVESLFKANPYRDQPTGKYTSGPGMGGGLKGSFKPSGLSATGGLFGSPGWEMTPYIVPAKTKLHEAYNDQLSVLSGMSHNATALKDFSPKTGNHIMDKKLQAYKDELLAIHADITPPAVATPAPNAPADLPGQHGIAKWNNGMIQQLKGATSLAELQAISVSAKAHASVKAYQEQLFAHFGAPGQAATVAAKAPKPAAPKGGVAAHEAEQAKSILKEAILNGQGAASAVGSVTHQMNLNGTWNPVSAQAYQNAAMSALKKPGASLEDAHAAGLKAVAKADAKAPLTPEAAAKAFATIHQADPMAPHAAAKAFMNAQLASGKFTQKQADAYGKQFNASMQFSLAASAHYVAYKHAIGPKGVQQALHAQKKANGLVEAPKANPTQAAVAGLNDAVAKATKVRALVLPDHPKVDTSGKYTPDQIKLFHDKVMQLENAAKGPQPLKALNAIQAQSHTMAAYKEALVAQVEIHLNSQPAKPVHVGEVVSHLKVVATKAVDGTHVEHGLSQHETFSERAGQHAYRYGTLTSQQGQHVDSYQGSGHTSFNTLRFNHQLQATEKHHVLDTALLNAPPTSKNMTVVRKLNSSELSHLITAKSLIGKVIEDPGYGSSSIDGVRWDGNVHFRINIPKGSRGMYLGTGGPHPTEREWLMPRNYRMVVKKVSKSGKRVTIHADALEWLEQVGIHGGGITKSITFQQALLRRVGL